MLEKIIFRHDKHRASPKSKYLTSVLYKDERMSPIVSRFLNYVEKDRQEIISTISR